MMTNIFLTGANGFIGNHVFKELRANVSFKVKPCSRTNTFPVFYNTFTIDDLKENIDWVDVLSDQEIVIHTAGRAHVLNDNSKDPLLEFRLINVNATLNLARQAAENGVRRFIYISSIKVIGEQTTFEKPFNEHDNPKPCPNDSASIAKYEAELGLIKIASECGMEIVIIRAPLVYGLGVKGNFASLLKLTLKRLPLPLGCINNQRSMVYVKNLVDLIVTCIDHPKAANQVFLVSDDEDVSTSDLLRRLGHAANRPARLINVPVRFLKFCARLLGKEAAVDRLTDSLQVDISHTKATLDWKPPYTVDEGLKSCFNVSGHLATSFRN